jgi:hypothetical protein
VRVDDITYVILGSSVDSLGVNLTSRMTNKFAFASITNTVVTPTQTILSAAAGPMQVNVTIFNPVEVY